MQSGNGQFMINFPCVCGHKENDHRYLYQDIYSYDGISARQIMGTACTKNCTCKSFVPDNLRYLEKCFISKQNN